MRKEGFVSRTAVAGQFQNTQAAVNIPTPASVSSRTTTRKIGKLTINVRSSFRPEKDLSDILFSVANARLKEKSV